MDLSTSLVLVAIFFLTGFFIVALVRTGRAAGQLRVGPLNLGMLFDQLRALPTDSKPPEPRGGARTQPKRLPRGGRGGGRSRPPRRPRRGTGPAVQKRLPRRRLHVRR
jgi:hypothetical protein